MSPLEIIYYLGCHNETNSASFLLQPAPLYWLNLDPSWRGTGPPMRRYFHPDGSQTADPTDRVWGGHECTYSIVTSFIGDEMIREHYLRIQRWPRMSVSSLLPNPSMMMTLIQLPC